MSGSHGNNLQRLCKRNKYFTPGRHIKITVCWLNELSIRTHSQHPAGLCDPEGVSWDSLWGASRTAVLSARAPTCDAVASDCHTPPDSKRINTRRCDCTKHSQLTFLLDGTCPIITWISRMMALNWGERSDQLFSSAMAWSKFLTYSPYIFRKGVSFCRMSPMRGVDVLEEHIDLPLRSFSHTWYY